MKQDRQVETTTQASKKGNATPIITIKNTHKNKQVSHSNNNSNNKSNKKTVISNKYKKKLSERLVTARGNDQNPLDIYKYTKR